MQQENDTIFRAICERITTRMKERGMTRIDLAKRSGVSYRTVYHIAKLTAHPRTEIVEALARVLRVDPEFLVSGKEATVGKEDGPEWIVNKPAKVTVVESIDDYVRKMAALLAVPEHELWNCVQDIIEKKRRASTDRKSKSA